jgi:hypothetical protein
MFIDNFDEMMKHSQLVGKELDYIVKVNDIMKHGNRLQKILVVCDLSFLFKTLWVMGGLRIFLKKSTYNFFWTVLRYDYWPKAQLLWRREGLCS